MIITSVTVAVPVLIFAVYYFWFTKPAVHYHAGFQVYVDGVRKDFSGFEYMTISPCSQNKKSGKEDPQLEKGHLHDGNGDVVHVHREGAVWQDLFTNLKYTFPSGKEIRAYVNGNQVDDILKQPITPYETVVIMVGKKPPLKDALAHAVTKDRIRAVEKSSEYCATGR